MTIEIPHHKMMPGHILEYRCPKFGLMFQWRVLGIFLGAEGQESLIEVEAIFMDPGQDSSGLPYKRLLVPEPMTRSLTLVAPGIGDGFVEADQ